MANNGRPEFTGGTRLSSDATSFLNAVSGLAEAAGAILVDRNGVVLVGDDEEELIGREVPLVWEGRVVAIAYLPGLENVLSRLVADVESQLGAPLELLDRTAKQRAVQLLDQRGAFQLRRSVDEVAEHLGVSRFTVYNYLNRERDAADADRPA